MNFADWVDEKNGNARRAGADRWNAGIADDCKFDPEDKIVGVAGRDKNAVLINIDDRCRDIVVKLLFVVSDCSCFAMIIKIQCLTIGANIKKSNRYTSGHFCLGSWPGTRTAARPTRC
jgi:hypothetical protein